MSTKSKINNYTEVLEKKYGKKGTHKRKQFDKDALDFYASQIIIQHRKEAKLTQQELADKTGIDKSYVSRIENGIIQPTVATFLKMINAMGKTLEIS